MGNSMAKAAWKPGHAPNVCVVGAGFAGLTCAWKLAQQGVKVTIVEARDRVGGRVQQLKTLGHWTDMGANWIHGPPTSPIRGLAEKVGAVTINPENGIETFDENGEILAEARSERLENVMYDTWARASLYARKHGQEIPASRSLKDYVTEQIGKSDLSDEDKQTVLHMSELWGSYIGSLSERQSLKYLFLEDSLEGVNVFLASTYKDILQTVADRTLNVAKVQYNTRVTGINTEASASNTSSTVKVSLQAQSGSLNGDKAAAAAAAAAATHEDYDAVIVTVPFGCLQSQQIAFTPALSDDLQHAIDSVTYGTLEKVYLRFPHAFWQSQPSEPGQTSSSSPSSSSSSSSSAAFFSHFIYPEYATSTNPSHWDIGVLNLASPLFDTAESKNSQPTLLFYIYGPCGTHVLSLIKDLDPSGSEYLARLSDFFRPYYSRLPNYRQPSGGGSSTDSSAMDSSACEPVAALSTNWQHDPLAGFGSYTNWQIDDNEAKGLPPKMPLDRAVETMRRGLPERMVWFAGEHTAPEDALGTVSGAYVSGEEVAGRVLETLRG